MKTPLQTRKFKKLLKQVSEIHYACFYLYSKSEQDQMQNLISSKEIVEKYCISNRTLQRYRTTGKLMPIARRKTYLYHTEAVEQFFKAYWERE